MQVKSIAECSKGGILQYFRPSLGYHLSLRCLFCLYLSGCLSQVWLVFIYFQSQQFNIDQLIGDIRQFYNLYGQEHSLSGRAIARIFHGIASPCYPATTWGRVRRFWRSHLNVDFNQLMKIATKELIGLRWYTQNLIWQEKNIFLNP